MMMMVMGNDGRYTHEWAVHIEGGEPAVQEVARRHDFDVMAKVRTTNQ